MSQSLMRSVVAAAFVSAATAVFGFPVTNYWQAVDGSYDGKWSETAHWSLGHLPQNGEYAMFAAWGQEGCPADKSYAYTIEVDGNYSADVLWFGVNGLTSPESVTFVGDGTVTFSGASRTADRNANNYFCNLSGGILFDGPSFDVRVGSPMSYSTITVQNGSTLTQVDHTMWSGNARLVVKTGGTVHCTGNLTYGGIAQTESVVVDGGCLKVDGQLGEADNRNKTRKFNVVLKGGSAVFAKIYFERGTESLDILGGVCTISTLLNLTDKYDVGNASIRIATGGRLCLNCKDVRIPDEAKQLKLEGGEVEFGYIFNSADDALPTRLMRSDGLAAVVCQSIWTPGYGEVVSKVPVVVSSFKNAYDNSGNQSLWIPKIVFTGGTAAPFGWTSSRDSHIHGPVTIQATADMNHVDNNCYNYFYDRVVFDTRDFYDPSVTRRLYIRGVTSGEGSLDLVARGGGTVRIDPCYGFNTYHSVMVETGTTLELGNRPSAAIGSAASDWSTLVTESFGMGTDAKLNFNPELQTVQASTWAIDPTATITVAAPTKAEYGAFPVLQDLESKVIPADVLARIVITGNESGNWTLKNEKGQITIYREYPEATIGASGYTTGINWEWVGGDGVMFTNVNNWVKEGSPMYMEQDMKHHFGSSRNSQVYLLNKMYRPTVPDWQGCSTKGMVFLETAVNSYFIYGGVRCTFNGMVENNSGVPQELGISGRWWSPTCFTKTEAPIVWTFADGTGHRNANFEAADANGRFICNGDIRFGASMTHPQLEMSAFTYPGSFSGFTVISGSVTFGRQKNAINLRKSNLRVASGGTLTFAKNDANGASYTLSDACTPVVINGTLNINAPMVGGINQFYRGAGEINIADPRPGEASSRMEFGGTLSVAPQKWETVVSGKSSAIALGARHTPTLVVPDGWTYGPASGAEAVATAGERAFVLHDSNTVVSVETMGKATFADPVYGPGELRAKTGTVVLSGSWQTSTKFTCESGASLAVRGNLEVGSVDVPTGAAITCAENASLQASGSVVIDGVVSVDNAKRWWTVIRAAKISGAPKVAEGYKCRIVMAEGLECLQVKEISGLSVVIR